MGLILHEAGVEQGGVLSSQCYTLVGDEELNCGSSSGLGADIGSALLSNIGSADDVVLLASDPHSLQSLLNISVTICQQRCMKLVPSKTKLLRISSKRQNSF